MPSPEVQRLLEQSRTLVQKGHEVVGALNETVDELRAAVQRVDRRSPHPAPYEGEERRQKISTLHEGLRETNREGEGHGTS